MSVSQPPRCVACGQQAWSVAFEHARDRIYNVPGEFTIWRCGECGLRRVWPVPEDLGRFYPSGYYSYAPGASPRRDLLHSAVGAARRTQLRLAWRAHALGVRLPRRMTAHPRLRSPAFRELTDYAPRTVTSVLDVGCGAGDFLVSARALGLKAHGVEMSESAAAAARERGLECAGDGIDSLLRTEERYDVIRLSDVLEHLVDPVQALRAVARCLSPQGVALVRVPNVDGMMARLSGPDWFQLDAPRHLWGFGTKNLTLLLGQAGLVAARTESGSEARVLYYALRDLLRYQAGLDMPEEPSVEMIRLCAHMGWEIDLAALGESLLVVAEHTGDQRAR